VRPARANNVERMIAKHGDAKLLYLLDTLTNCPKMQSANIYDRCKATYEGLNDSLALPGRPFDQSMLRSIIGITGGPELLIWNLNGS
jgi:hypothetical protein